MRGRQLFPDLPLRALGFDHVAIAGQKGYHGVAILSRLPFVESSAAIFAAAVMRDISRSCSMAAPRRAKPLTLHNVYVPAGGDLPDPALNPKFRHKLDFLEAMEAWFRGVRGKRTNRMILVGDLNVAPLADRCVVAQATSQSGEPHPCRGRALPAHAGCA